MHTGSVDGLPLRAGLRPSEAALDMAARHQTCKKAPRRPFSGFVVMAKARLAQRQAALQRWVLCWLRPACFL